MTDEDETIVTDSFFFAVANETLNSLSGDYPNVINETTMSIEWDEWDDLLWTPEQRQQLQQDAILRQVRISLGLILALVVFFGVITNSTILFVFSR